VMEEKQRRQPLKTLTEIHPTNNYLHL
jgi:hypothetical protein